MPEDKKPNPEDFTPEGSGTRSPASPDSTPEAPTTVIGSDDLSKESKVTLAHYLSNLTKQAPRTNAFPIVAEPVGEFGISTQDGSGTPAIADSTTPGFTQTLTFSGNEGAAAVSLFKTLSDSGDFVSLGELINKIARSPHGHQILSSFKANAEPFEPGVGDTTGRTFLKTKPTAGKLQKRVSEILKKNRFSPTENTPYIDNGEFSDPGAAVPQGLGSSRAVVGQKYNYESGPAANVGSLLTILQTGHSADEASSEGLTFLPPLTVLPTQVQTGFGKVSMEKLYASDVVGFSRTSLEGTLRYAAPESFGAMSSWHEPFEGAGLAAMMTAGASLAGSLVAAMLFGIIFEMMSKFLDEKLNVESFKPNRHPLGASGFSSFKAKAFTGCGVPVTENSFAMCLMTGLASFLGVALEDWPKVGDKPGLVPGSLIGAYFLKVSLLLVDIVFGLGSNAGWLSVLGRVVNRDFMGVLDAFKETFSSPMGLMTAALNLVGLVAGISSSIAFRFFMALAVAGDKALLAMASQGTAKSDPEGLLTSGQTRIYKSRENDSELKLAWRQKSAPGMLLLPPQITSAFAAFDRGLGTAEGAMGAWASRPTDDSFAAAIARKQVFAVSNRIDKAQVELLENALEAEYMPFYFHDLRTNEIISFHAFLEDVKDSYSVNYAETGGYGRIDKVKVYQDTSRDINVSFWVAATSKEDFDSMWWSINKLITLLYPQWSMGTQVVSGDVNFIQPFSQIPTASPMIRLRVGDIIKSNYSRFNTARLFGLSEVKSIAGADPYGDISGFDWDSSYLDDLLVEDKPADPLFTVGGVAIDQEAAKNLKQREDAQKKRHSGKAADDKGFVVGEKVRYPSVDSNIINKNNFAMVLKDAPDQSLNVTGKYTISVKGIIGKITRIMKQNKTPNAGGALHDLAKSDDLLLIEPDESYLGLVTNGTRMFRQTLGDKKETVRFWITAGALAEEERYDGAFPGWKTELDEFPFASSDSTALKAIQDFFSPEKNAIIQSFESAGGRGLAGFITSFDMDWNDQIWEVDGVGNRAPKSLKISIAFSPVHDIVPGLDHHGFTRAVNYPVGKTSATFGQDQHGEGYAGQSNAEAGEEIPGTIPNAQYFYADATAKLIHPDTPPKPPKDGKKG